MKAISLDRYVPSYEELEMKDIPKPTPKPGYALVKVKVASGNPVDAAIAHGYLTGVGWVWPLPFTLGHDFSGIVEAVGEGVSNVSAGDAVFGLSWSSVVGRPYDDGSDPDVGGAFAEYILIPATKLSKKPEALSFEVAATLGIAATTAHEALVKIGKVTPGTRVLILGGSSAVGIVAVQLAKLLGAHVTTTASTRAMSLVQQLNAADKIINYTETKWEDDPELKNVDVIFDTVGEKDGLARAIASGVAKPGGVFATIADFSVGYNPSAHPPLAWASAFVVKQDSVVQSELAELIVQGKLRIVIDETFPFTREGVINFLNKIESKKSLGKNLLTFP